MPALAPHRISAPGLFKCVHINMNTMQNEIRTPLCNAQQQRGPASNGTIDRIHLRLFIHIAAAAAAAAAASTTTTTTLLFLRLSNIIHHRAATAAAAAAATVCSDTDFTTVFT